MSENNHQQFSAAVFNKYLDQEQLMATKCLHCNNLFIPPREICPECLDDQMIWVPLSGNGKVAAFTVIYVGPTFMNTQGYDRKNPYITGIVELEEGLYISARLLGFEALDPETVEIGTPVKVEFVQIENGEHSFTQLAFRSLQS